ncbi:MAG: ABC transporter permease [Gammaproteobacteria bacterium]|nr:ABC transporter permease [Gammaproteobacteria bacterium]
MSIRSAVPATVILIWCSVAIIAPLLPLKPDEILLSKILIGPSADAWLGYDDLGRSIADRLLMGARTSLAVASSVVSISLAFGTFVGIVSAWLGGWWDHVIVRIIDVFIAFPGILLAIALAGLLGPGIGNAVIALAVVGWVGYARLARAQALAVKHREHIDAARALGTGRWRIGVRHLLLLISAPLIVEATFGIAGVVIAEASLSFLGLGVQPPAASWGSMIRDGARYMLVSPHMVLAPGIAIVLVVLSINLLGDRLRDWMDVRLRP